MIVRAVEAGIPTPVFSSSLAYYDGLRSKRLPTALTQSQRDFFGAHTYGRVDKPGVFHTLWAEEGKPEIERSLVISGLGQPCGCPAFFRLGDSRAEKTASPRSSVAIDELSPSSEGGLIHSQLGDGFFGGEPDELVHSVGVGGRVIRVVGLLEDMGQRFGFAGTGGEEPRMA